MLSPTLPWTLVRDARPPVGHRYLLLAVVIYDGAPVMYATGYYDSDDGREYFIVDGDDEDGNDAAAVIAWLELTPPRVGTGPLFTGLKS